MNSILDSRDLTLNFLYPLLASRVEFQELYTKESSNRIDLLCIALEERDSISQ